MVHTFSCLGHEFMLDVESGSLFEIDKPTKKVVDERNSPNGYVDGEFCRDCAASEKEICEELDNLGRAGALFTPYKPFSPPPSDGVIKSLCLNVCHNCNLACEYCFADEGKYSGEKASMTTETACAALDFLVERSASRVNLEVDFFGGEPLMNFDVVKKAVEYGRSLEKTHNKVFRFTITTNALNLSDDVADFLNKEMHNVVISIDGRKDVHNTVRKTVGGKGSFDIALKNALNFRAKRGDKQYYIRGTYTSLNKDFAADALALNDYGFDQVSLEPVVLPSCHRLALSETDVAELAEQYEILAQEYIKRRQNADTWFNFFHFMIDFKHGPCEYKRYSSCGAGTEYVAIAPSGDIYPCHQFVGNEKMKIGNIACPALNTDIRKYFDGNNLSKKPECLNCWAKYYCSGGCAANALNFNKTIDKPYKLACELMRKRMECALAIYCLENGK